ncbi:MAG: hypothetical protein ACI9YH_001362 [Colwellia sp.]|jgi:hypothetical protein
MIQKIFSITMAILGVWLFQRFDSFFAFILIFIAVLMYRGADHGVWFYFDLRSDSDSDFGSGGDLGDGGGGD